MKNFIMNKRYLWINILLMFITYGIWLIVYFCLKSTYSKENTNIADNNNRTWVLKISVVTFNNISSNRIIKVTVADMNTFLNENNKNIYYLKIKLLIKK